MHTFLDGVYKQQLTYLNVALFCDRARELLGFNSVIPEE